MRGTIAPNLALTVVPTRLGFGLLVGKWQIYLVWNLLPLQHTYNLLCTWLLVTKLLCSKYIYFQKDKKLYMLWIGLRGLLMSHICREHLHICLVKKPIVKQVQVDYFNHQLSTLFFYMQVGTSQKTYGCVATCQVAHIMQHIYTRIFYRRNWGTKILRGHSISIKWLGLSFETLASKTIQQKEKGRRMQNDLTENKGLAKSNRIYFSIFRIELRFWECWL